MFDRQFSNALDNHIMGVHWEDGMDTIMWHVVEKQTGIIMETFEDYDDAWQMCYYMNMDAREFTPYNLYTLMDSVDYEEGRGNA
jgi:hypothetical protein